MQRSTLTLVAVAWLGSLGLAYYTGSIGGDSAAKANADAQTVGGNGKSQPAITGSSGGATLGSQSGDRGDGLRPWETEANENDPEWRAASLMAELDRIFAGVDRLDRTRNFLDLVEELEGEDFAIAAEHLQSLGDGRENWLQRSLLMYAWGRKDPEAAIAWAEEQGSGHARYSVLTGWAETSPDRALAWAMENAPVNENGEPGENWNMMGVVNGMLRVDVAGAADAVEMMNFGRARGSAMERVMRKLHATDPEQAKAWVASIEDPRLKSGATDELAERMAREDLESAKDWVTSLEPGEARSRAIGEVIQRWVRDDPNAAGEWLNQFPKTEEYDRARRDFAFGVDEREPETAMAWAASIVDSQARDRALSRIARSWVRRDEGAAKAFIQASEGLPQNVQRLGQ